MASKPRLWRPNEFRAAMAELGFTVRTWTPGRPKGDNVPLAQTQKIALELGISRRQVQRYWAGDTKIRSGSTLALRIEEKIAAVKQTSKK